MSSSGLSKAVLSSPGQSVSHSSDQRSAQSSSSEFSARMKVDYSVDYSLSTLQKDNHNKRMKALRKELNNLQTTAWKYQPIDKYIGHYLRKMGILSWFWNMLGYGPRESSALVKVNENMRQKRSYFDWFWNLILVDIIDVAAEEEAERLEYEENQAEINAYVRAKELKLIELGRLDDDIIESSEYSKCLLRTGMITDLRGESGFIDANIKFERHNAPANIALHQVVSYLAYRASEEDEWTVRKILPSEERVWEGEDEETYDSMDTDPTRLADVEKEVQYRSVLVKVTQRRGREIVVNDGEFQFNLDKVITAFTPIVGDFLYLDAVVEHDVEVADFGGAILDVDRIRWVRYQVKSSEVTDVSAADGCGRVGVDVFFNRDACKPGYVPCRGDSVNVEAIESYQGKCSWRALMVAPVPNARKSARVNTNATAVEIQALCQPKNGIEANTKELDFGQVLIMTKGGVVTVKLKNTGTETQSLMYGDFYSTIRECQISPVRPVDKSTLPPGHTLEFLFQSNGKYIGLSKELFVFAFKGFKVGVYFTIDVYDPESLSMVSTEAATGRSDKTRRPVTRPSNAGMNVMRGVRPIIPPKFMAVRREPYNVPERFWKAVLDSNNTMKTIAVVKDALLQLNPSFGTNLTFRNYRQFFHSLLYLEEMDNIMKVQEYNMTTVMFQRAGDYLSLEVPGLAEKRPSLLVGDRVFATQPWKKDDVVYEGYIHKTFARKVWIKFNNSFHLAYQMEVADVRFEFGRTPIRRQHNAIEDAMDHLGEMILFPTKLVLQPPQVDLDENPDDTGTSLVSSQLFSRPDPTRRTVTWINTSLNYHQREAVRNVLKGEARPLPYIIFGPPGTGKTVTMVETILQILFLMPNSRLLVATPSNSSANLIAERLLDSGLLKPGDLVRLVGYHVLEEGSLSDKLRPYATTGILKDTRGDAAEPAPLGEIRESSNRNTLGRHRITVGTCIALGQLVMMDFPQGHFTHVVIDEAGQASEPEILVPLGFLDQSGQAVLAGDPLQLGPVVGSTLAKSYGLGESYLDRLTNRFPYQRDVQGFPATGGFDPRLVTRLVNNYRSLPEILALPNNLFYDSLLRAEVSATEGPDADLLTQLGVYLPTREASFGGPPPILFHGTVGTNLQENDSPSWFNPQEAVTAYGYLVKAYMCGLRPEDVGVITPYRKQVQKLRWYFGRQNLSLPKIGSVEEFQGQERRVIIMSCVRSSRQHIDADIIHSLGFVASPKRLNVAITRARSLLVIIGNPHLLSADPYWRSVIRYCVERQCYTGCEPPINCLDGGEASADDTIGSGDMDLTMEMLDNMTDPRYQEPTVDVIGKKTEYLDVKSTVAIVDKKTEYLDVKSTVAIVDKMTESGDMKLTLGNVDREVESLIVGSALVTEEAALPNGPAHANKNEEEGDSDW